jgi:hypothetical protein
LEGSIIGPVHHMVRFEMKSIFRQSVSLPENTEYSPDRGHLALSQTNFGLVQEK